MLVAVVPLTRARLQQTIVCEPDAISIPGQLGRSPTRLRWDIIREIRAETGETPATALVSPTSLQWRRSWIQQYDWPLIITTEGRVIEVTTLATAAVSEGWNPTGRSGTQQRVALILRYHESLGIPWATSNQPVEFPSGRRPWLSTVAGVAVIAALIWWSRH